MQRLYTETCPDAQIKMLWLVIKYWKERYAAMRERWRILTVYADDQDIMLRELRARIAQDGTYIQWLEERIEDPDEY